MVLPRNATRPAGSGANRPAVRDCHGRCVGRTIESHECKAFANAWALRRNRIRGPARRAAFLVDQNPLRAACGNSAPTGCRESSGRSDRSHREMTERATHCCSTGRWTAARRVLANSKPVAVGLEPRLEPGQRAALALGLGLGHGLGQAGTYPRPRSLWAGMNRQEQVRLQNRSTPKVRSPKPTNQKSASSSLSLHTSWAFRRTKANQRAKTSQITANGGCDSGRDRRLKLQTPHADFRPKATVRDDGRAASGGRRQPWNSSRTRPVQAVHSKEISEAAVLTQVA